MVWPPLHWEVLDPLALTHYPGVDVFAIIVHILIPSLIGSFQALKSLGIKAKGKQRIFPEGANSLLKDDD